MATKKTYKKKELEAIAHFLNYMHTNFSEEALKKKAASIAVSFTTSATFFETFRISLVHLSSLRNKNYYVWFNKSMDQIKLYKIRKKGRK